MTIISEQTPVYYRTVRMGVERTPDGVAAILDFVILNQAGAQVGTASQTTTLTAQQKLQLAAFVENAEAEFEAGAGAGLAQWEA